MNIVTDLAVNLRLRRFLAQHVARRPRTDVGYIRREVRAVTEAGDDVPVPEGAIDVMLAFEDRFGGLSYEVPGWPNEIEYGLDGDASLHQTPLGWAFYGILDGSLTAPLDVLLDGRVTARLGYWPQRVVDDSVEQRLNKHALLVEVSSMPQAAFSLAVVTDEPATVPILDLPVVGEASGGGDVWWRDMRCAVWWHLIGWPPEGPHRWTVTCFAATRPEAEDLSETVRRSIPPAAASD